MTMDNQWWISYHDVVLEKAATDEYAYFAIFLIE